MPYSDPIMRRRVAREAMRRRRARERGQLIPLTHSVPGGALSPHFLSEVLAAELNAVRDGSKPGGFERARVVVLLVQAALRCFEMSDLVSRVEALESAIESRETGGAYEETN